MELTYAIAAAIVVAALYWFLTSAGKTPPAQARELVEKGARLVDVRTPTEFASGHLPGAINVPLDQLSGRTGELGKKDEPLVLYCRSGARSGSAARQLKAAGFSAVHDLGGMGRW